MKKSLKVLIVIAALFGFGAATVSANPLDYNNALGLYFNLGEYSGNYGVQYQHWFNEKCGMQVDGYVQYLPTYTKGDVNLDLTGEFDYSLFQGSLWNYNATKLYAWGMIGPSLKFYTKGGSYTPGVDFKLGAGFTFEFDFLEHFSIPVKFGFGGSVGTGVGFTFGSGLRFLY